VAYEDQGSLGPCGQTVENTSPWRTLHVFMDEDKFREFIKLVTENSHKLGRKQPRIVGVWSEGLAYHNVVHVL